MINFNGSALRLPLALLIVAGHAYPQNGKLSRKDPITLNRILTNQNIRTSNAINIYNNIDRSLHGLSGDHSFILRDAKTDEFGITHARLIQHYNNIPIYGQEITLHIVDDTNNYRTTNDPIKINGNNPKKQISLNEAIKNTITFAGLKYNILDLNINHFRGNLEYFPTYTKNIKSGKNIETASAEDIQHNVKNLTLAYHIIISRPENPNAKDLKVAWNRLPFSDIMIDAESGAVLKEWNNNPSQIAGRGTGRSSMYGNRPVSFINNPDFDTFSTFNYHYALIYENNPTLVIKREKPPEEYMEIIPYEGGYTDPIPEPTIIYHWPFTTYFSAPDPYGVIGDGRFYTCYSEEMYLNGSSPIIDIYYAVDAAHKVLTVPFGRADSASELNNFTIMTNRIIETSCTDSSTSTIYIKNYARHTNLACDGTLTTNGHPSAGYHTSANVVCHELGHALIDRCPNYFYFVHTLGPYLIADSESAALHEGNAEIFSAIAVQYGRQGGVGMLQTPNVDPTALDGLNFDEWYDLPVAVYGKKLYAEPYKTSDTNSSVNINYWSPEIGGGSVQVHQAGKPAERFFCYLVLGSTTNPNMLNDQRYSIFNNTVGIGMDAAYRIWHRALVYYSSRWETYYSWIQGMARATKDLYGNPSNEMTAVKNAAKAININIDNYNP